MTHDYDRGDLDTETAARELAMSYRRVFGTPEGRMVLHDILEDLGMYGTLSNQELVIRHNYGRILLSKLGGQAEQDYSAVTDAYINLTALAP